MGYKEQIFGAFIDRHEENPERDPIDVVMLTLDAASFLERCLYSIYREIPVRRLLVCDGGSTDGTTDILNKYPRVQVFIRPDIRTTGKATEFLLSQVQTEWFAFVDSDIELPSGWYDEMCKYKCQHDVLENSRRLMAYHYYRQDPGKLRPSVRAYDFCHLGRKEAMKNYICDDDYIWGMNDIFFRYVVEKSGYRYGKVSTTHHLHHLTETTLRKSDQEKAFVRVVFREPEWVIVDKAKYDRMVLKFAKGILKYVEPGYPLVEGDLGLYETLVRTVSREWVAKHAPVWVKTFDNVASPGSRLQRHLITLRRSVMRRVRVPGLLRKSYLLRRIATIILRS